MLSQQRQRPGGHKGKVKSENRRKNKKSSITNKAANKAVVTSQHDRADLFEEIAERTSDGITIIHDSRLVYVNPGLVKMLGYRQEEMENTGFLGYVHPEDRKRAEEIYSTRLSGQQVPAQYFMSLLGKNGSKIDVAINAGIINYRGENADFVLIHDISHQKQVERSLRKSEERYRNIFDLAPDGIVAIDIDGTVTSFNHSFQKLSGFSEAEIIGKHISNLPILHTKDLPRYMKVLHSIQRGNKPRPIEFSWKHKDGTPRWGEAHISPVREGDRVTGVLGIIRDITERKNIEALIHALNRGALAMSEASTPSAIFEAAAKVLEKLGFMTMVLLLNEKEDRLSISHVSYPKTVMKAAEKYTGLKQADYSFPMENVAKYQRVIKQKDTVFIDDIPTIMRQVLPDTMAGLAEQLIKILKIPRAIAAPLIAEDKVLGILSVQSDKLTADAAPTITAFANQMAATWSRAQALELARQEINERRRAMEEAATLLAAIEQAEEIIVVTDTSRIIEYVNPAFERITGYSREEVVGNSIGMLRSYVHAQDVYREIADAIALGNSWHGRLIDRIKDGSPIELETTISPVRDSTGKVIGRISVQRDVTEQTHLEEQLRQAQKMEAVGKLAGGIAHDFNNLLTTILGYTDLVLEDPTLTGRTKENIGEIKNSAGRASSLTQQLLAYSRQQILQPRLINLNDVIKNLKNILTRLIGEDITLRVNLYSDLGAIEADPSQFEQVIMNLAINARDAMPNGGVLELSTGNIHLEEAERPENLEASSGDYVLLSVRDNGEGMSEKVKKNIFDPFFTTKKVGEGTGLGLSTVYGIVKQSGGQITVESVAGQGTVFKIYLPIAERERKKTQPREDASKLPPGRGVVLLVEDESSLRNLIAKILQSAGYSVTTAAGGKDALSKVTGQDAPQFDLLITDVIMPAMSGKELSERISVLRPGNKTLFISGYPDDRIAHHGVLEEGVTFLQKPFSPTALIAKVQELLRDE
jgi:PAS domain S-box-containing protein